MLCYIVLDQADRPALLQREDRGDGEPAGSRRGDYYEVCCQ